MKHLRLFSILAAAILLTVSCEEEDSPNSPFSAATIQFKSAEVEETIGFANSFVIREVHNDGKYDGLSWLSANSDGRMAYDMFYLSFYFDQIDNVKPGTILKHVRSVFSFPASSDSRNYTTEYKGKLSLKDKGDDYVIIHFNNVKFSVAYGDYVFDGDLQCPLLDKYPWE